MEGRSILLGAASDLRSGAEGPASLIECEFGSRDFSTGVIALVPERWFSMARTTRHNVMERLANHFEVVWVEPSIYWREYTGNPANLVMRRNAFRLGEHLHVLPPDPLTPKCFRPSVLASLFDRRRMRAAERILRDRGCKRIVLYLWRPEFAPAIDELSSDLVCYHIDDEYTFSKDDIPLQPAEATLISRSDRVFVSSKQLLAKKGHLNSASFLVPNGVDFRAYSTPCAEPADLSSIPRPRVGYVGVIKQHLDLQLMLDVARLRPQWSVVFIGPEGPLGDQASAMDELRRQPNVHFIERRPQNELPAYVQHLDVCSLCYVLNGYTKYIYPLKLHEYLASGQPVVSTHLPALAEFSGTIAFAGGASEWCAAIDHLLTPEERSNSRVEQRRQVARHYDWDRLVARIAASIHSGLATRASSGV